MPFSAGHFEMKSKHTKIWQSGRIAYYSIESDQAYWDDIWATQISKEYYTNYEQGKLDEYSPSFEKYLKKSDMIIEAGCGTARFVVALQARGFRHVTGIDWGEPTIAKVRTLFPELPIKVGDVTHIDVEDGYYDAYISLGVVEHRKEGPEPFLMEAFRVTNPGGYALISVPYVNQLRLLKAKLGVYKSKKLKDLSFYQYAFQKAEFQQLLEGVGFRVLEVKGISGWFGIREEIPLLASFLDNIPGGYRVQGFLRRLKLLDHLGHMALYVCTK